MRKFRREESEMISFKGAHFPSSVILMAVRWYVAYALSYRDMEELMAERGICVDHATLARWVVKYAPQLEEEFRRRYKRPVGSSWRMDETYIKIKGQWHYLYRAVDKDSHTIDSWLSSTRNRKDAHAFFTKAISLHGLPSKVTIDKSGSNKAGVARMNLVLVLLATLGFLASEKQEFWWFQIPVRQSQYLNNCVEQDHRFIKRLTKPMMGFKSFSSAKATLSGIELHHMLRKSQHINSPNQNIFQQFYSLAA
jgi:putative transposase